jgi:uncharacterized protein (DUF305 family)
MKLAIASVIIAGAAALAATAIAQDSPSSKAYMDAHHKMMSSMEKMKPSGDPDKDFLTMMIPHHQGAIDMAEVQVKYGKDEKVKAMAQKIIDDQEREIAEMKKMLEK